MANSAKPVRSGRIAAITLIVLFLLFIVIASTVPIAKGVVSAGVVVADSNRKTLQHKEGGVIKAINVKEGQPVLQETVLIELDDTSARVGRDLVRIRYLNALATLDRLLSLQANQSSIIFRDELLGEQYAAHLAEMLLTQRVLHETLINEKTGKREILTAQLKQLTEKQKGLKKLGQSIEEQLAILSRDINKIQELVDAGLVETTVLIERQQLISKLHGDYGTTLASIQETHSAISSANLQIVQVEKEWQQQLAREIGETQEAVVEQHNQLIAAENVLARSTIKAPQDGIVFDLQYHTVGGVIIPGEKIMDIVPQDSKLAAELFVRTLDIDAIEVGMKAFVRFPSYSAKAVEGIFGNIDYISADAMTTEYTADEKHYIARLSIPNEERKRIANLQVYPGMPIEAYFEGGSRTLLAYLFDPILVGFNRAIREE